MMARLVCFSLAVLSTLFVLTACSPAREGTGDDRTLATINDYHLSLDAFQRQLAAELELEADYKLTRAAQREFLQSLIRKELLLQEAVRRKLDRREAFTAAIEKYWESTLIRDLIDLKSQEISRAITVTEEEIDARYAALKQATPGIGPLDDERRERLRSELTAAKKTAHLESWIDGLQRNAAIEIDETLLARP